MSDRADPAPDGLARWAVQISDVLRYKGDEVITTTAQTPVRELLRLLAEHRIGALVVVAGETEAAAVSGIVSERDVVRRLHDRGADLLDATVGEIMTSTVIGCTPHDSLDSIATTMTERRVRHMPVLDEGRLVGIVSIGDVVSARMRQLEQDRAQLEQYITG
ncbi:CBS domain-containing protein [Jatrophihabitans cynanchi]|jgi:CBS domain-containing protein|uniref:CBS domain-containing protein n=1 Tax=Jatrophihabitans cynanchi TaxID=2944128 RepID=A0ABY7K1E0_9ACTN|nr:CBS domain-containing protein [Jatrophihabitans sp. SB3-54]WAX58658.1 CBS domain-containing protein [Jatrophihabitans sp. SB3-54]